MPVDRNCADAALDPTIRSRIVHNINGLSMHVLEAGFETPRRPLALLLHGFPELAYSWRKVIVPLASAGFHVVAPDQRGYGATTGWDPAYDGDLASFRMLNLARDALGLVATLGYREIAAVIGHDFGASVAGWCALIRPDMFKSVVLMSAPFQGPPAMPFDTADAVRDPSDGPITPVLAIDPALAALNPPRKHYHAYYASRPADADMRQCRQGLHAFLRAYYHQKSGDWPGNEPVVLQAWSAAELAKLPTYYVMHRDQTMAEAVASTMPTDAEIQACNWLTEAELAVYAAEFARTGFQGGLNWYRARLVPGFIREMQLFSGRTIDVPACFISGACDWGIHQTPGALERMQTAVCTDFRSRHLIDGAGHWVQQERPEEVVRQLLAFLGGLR